jgi:hypothetical protein
MPSASVGHDDQREAKRAPQAARRVAEILRKALHRSCSRYFANRNPQIRDFVIPRRAATS